MIILMVCDCRWLRRRDLEDSEPSDDDVESDDEMEMESENEEANDDSNA